VGALTSGTYRYQTRPWEMHHVGTICTHCADGCRTTLGVRNDKIIRGNNRDRSGVNGEFLCVKGRYAFDFVEHPERLQSPMLRSGDQFEPISWAVALEIVARKFTAAKSFGVIGSNHTTNEENYFLAKMARQGLKTENIDHHRTGDLATLFDALSGKPPGQHAALATTADLYSAKSILIVGADLSQQHPFLAYQARANFRHHAAHIYAVTTGPVREDQQAAASVRVEKGNEIAGVESLRDKLKGESELVIVFGDAIQGDVVRKLVGFGDSLGVPVKYVCLVDYSNSRGAFDMGLIPKNGGMSLQQMLAAELDVLWVVGANPLKHSTMAPKSFVVVQDLFMTETASHADLVLPAASAYEKTGTVTNVCGEAQKLKHAVKVMGTKTDLEIMGLIAKEMKLDLGIWLPDKIFEEIRKNVHGYDVSKALIDLGAVATAPLNGRVAALPGAIYSSGDTLFTSGSLTKYSKILNEVMEAPGALYGASGRWPVAGGQSEP
jgi:NADH-quinone oxidoreductase subunit G